MFEAGALSWQENQWADEKNAIACSVLLLMLSAPVE